MVHDTIPINVDDIPYTQPIELDSGTYDISLTFNRINRRYYIDIADEDGNPIAIGEPIYLNQPLWRNINNTKLPVETIIPMDEAGIETDVNTSNFGDTVQLCIDNLGDDDSAEDED